jgi:hypothetical protein
MHTFRHGGKKTVELLYMFTFNHPKFPCLMFDTAYNTSVKRYSLIYKKYTHKRVRSLDINDLDKETNEWFHLVNALKEGEKYKVCGMQSVRFSG